MTPFSLRDWRQSIICLGFEITRLAFRHNLLPDAAGDRHEYFFSDSGIPRPRPCTALAWASLCAFGPIQGYVDHEENHFPFRLDTGRFLLPFLPKLLRDEDTNQSLHRQSKAHMRDSEDRIIWGSIYIGDSRSGSIEEKVQQGQVPAKAWMDSKPTHHAILNVRNAGESIPPLWASADAGWQFGVVQAIHGTSIMLRDPMVQLAQYGISELRYGGKYSPCVNRLLLRILKDSEAQVWASAYSSAVHADKDSILRDQQDLAFEILVSDKRQAEEASETPKAKGRPKKQHVLAANDPGLMANLAVLTQKFLGESVK